MKNRGPGAANRWKSSPVSQTGAKPIQNAGFIPVISLISDFNLSGGMPGPCARAAWSAARYSAASSSAGMSTGTPGSLLEQRMVSAVFTWATFCSAVSSRVRKVW